MKEKENKYKKIEFSLQPDKESDESKIALSLNEEDGSAILKIYDCNDHTSHMIRPGVLGARKLERLKLAIEMLIENNEKNSKPKN